MLEASLPELKKESIGFPYFPTRQQVIVWRNWGLVPIERIADVLDTSEENVILLARDMGLRSTSTVDENWLKRGYITIIRANWHILSYRQLLILLGWTVDKLAYVLKEDDFLSHKLGGFKPDVDEVSYKPLTEKQKKQTQELRNIIDRHFADLVDKATASPFDFLKEFEVKKPERKKIGGINPGEIILDDKWGLVYPDNAINVKFFVERFISSHGYRWGIGLNNSINEKLNKNIVLEIQPENSKLSESHMVEVTGNTINIRAVDEVGLLRGLQWIEKEMEARGGPFLKIGKVSRETKFETRIIHAYSAVFGDPLLETEFDPYPEGLLAKLSELGINGIWLHGLLYNLVPWDEEPSLSNGWETRIEGLRNLIKKAARYGIGIYLYLNEPRSMSNTFFEKHPDWKGYTKEGHSALCTSVESVRDYLKSSVRKLFIEAPDLAGIITITMSENLTNCYSRAFEHTTSCPRCSQREPQEVVAEVNRLIAEGAYSIKPDAKIICWTWGWQSTCGRDQLWTKEAVNLLPDKTELMCTSEEAVETDIAGIKGSVIDYSMSITGPGKRALENWMLAASNGHKTMAKVQFNNTWECSAVPYIPVPGLVIQHIQRLMGAGVTGLMLGWSLGGYPSLNLELTAQYYFGQDIKNETDLVETAQKKYGEKSGRIVCEAWECFNNAFKEFPFNISVLYKAPQNFGPGNILSKNPTKLKATMIGFPYDDLETWRGIYPEDIFEEQFRKLSEKWKKGIDRLTEAESMLDVKCLDAFEDMNNVAQAVFCHFRSTYLQIAFVRLRNKLLSDFDRVERNDVKERLCRVLAEEMEMAKMLYKIVSRDSRIGYEASNHYYYTTQDLIEKVICCEYLLEEYRADN